MSKSKLRRKYDDDDANDFIFSLSEWSGLLLAFLSLLLLIVLLSVLL